jgi:hypothetical protein
MNKRLLSIIVIAFFLVLVIVVPQLASCQTADPDATLDASPTDEAPQGGNLDFLLIGVIVAVVAVVAVVVVLVVFKRRKVNEKSLTKLPSREFQDWVIQKFNGKPGDPASGVDGYTQGGQPLLVRQSDHVGLAEIQEFVNVLAKGKAAKGTIVAFNYDNDTFDVKVSALDRGIELEMLRIYELLDKRSAPKINKIAAMPIAFDAPLIYPADDQVADRVIAAETFERTPNGVVVQNGVSGKPLIFISHSNTKVAEQVKRMLDFLHYNYVVGDKEETSVPIPEGKFGVMQGCDCAIINIAAAEQERRYSGMYVLNANVVSEINAAYLKYNMQVILLVERKVELPPNLKGLKRIDYDSDDLSFNAAMDLDKALVDFKKL